jgi:hypothetical protein
LSQALSYFRDFAAAKQQYGQAKYYEELGHSDRFKHASPQLSDVGEPALVPTLARGARRSFEVVSPQIRRDPPRVVRFPFPQTAADRPRRTRDNIHDCMGEGQEPGGVSPDDGMTTATRSLSIWPRTAP